MSSFTDPLVVTQIDAKFWLVTRSFEYRVGSEDSNEAIRVPVGFRTDFASIPRWAWWLIGHPAGEYAQAAVLHDWLYSENADEQTPDYKPRTRKECDDIFLEAMAVLDVAWWKRSLMHRAVRWQGWRAWGDERKKIKES